MPFFREGLPLLALSLAGVASLLGLRSAQFRRAAFLGAAAAAWFALDFVRGSDGDSNLRYGIMAGLFTIVAALLLKAVFPGERQEGEGEAAPLLPLSLLWIGGFALFYAFWIKFHANYIAEFLPGLALLAGAGAAVLAVRGRKFARIGMGIVLVYLSAASYLNAYHIEHTGTFDPRALQEAVDYARENIGKDQEVLTGALAIPFAAGLKVPFYAAHPTWYGYGFIEPELRNVFMAPAEQMAARAAEEVPWIIMDKVTEFSYIVEYPAIEEALRTRFEKTAEIENMSNPIVFYRRK